MIIIFDIFLFQEEMNVIGEKGEYKSEYIKELFYTKDLSIQQEGAIRILSSRQFVSRVHRDICIAAYLLLHETPDDLYKKFKEPIGPTNRELCPEERNQLVALLRRLNLEAVTAEILSDEKTESSSPSVAVNGEATAVKELPVATDSAHRTQTRAPPIYDQSGGMNKPYAEVLQRKLGINTWIIRHNDEKPFELWGELPEEEFREKFHAADATLSERLFRFLRYKQVRGFQTRDDGGLSSGSFFEEKEFLFSRTMMPLTFAGWASGRGSVGLFLKMDHPTLGKTVYLLTCAHIVFSNLSLKATGEEEMELFNRVVDYAHYDPTGQSDSNFSNSLDFCLLEVPSEKLSKLQNASLCELRDLKAEPVPEGSKIWKKGWKAGLTNGFFVAPNMLVNGRESVAVRPNAAATLGPFATEGDSGSVYLYEDADTGSMVPIAIHRMSGRGADKNPIHGGCSIVECLQKFVEKRTGADQPPPAAEILQTFRSCGPDVAFESVCFH